MSYVIGITGGIASGKSTVSSYLTQQNYILVDCDKLTSQSYIDCFEEIKQAFPNCIIDEEISRPHLAKRVFSSKEDKETLEGIIHPYVRKKMEEVISNSHDEFVFLDIPLLYEAKMEDLCDEIWVVYVPKDVQLARLMHRNQLDEKTAMMRIDAQMSLELKKEKADVVINNTTSLEDLYSQVEHRLEVLRNGTHKSR